MQTAFNPKLFVTIAALLFIVVASAQLPSSSFSYNCTRDTLIQCGPRCITIKAQVPNIRSSTADYIVSKTSEGGCFNGDIVSTLSGPSTNLVEDDVYSDAIPLLFNFPFFNNIYSQLAVGGNGTVSFDLAMANERSDWTIQNNLPATTYDRAVIMAPFHDMDIRQNTSSNRQIKYDVIGTAPHRKFILSYYKIPLFDCTSLIQNTSQLILHEGTGIVEVLIYSREVCTTWNSGRAIIGMQNYDRNKAIMAPGRTATSPQWGGVDMNESWRFTPASGAPLFKKAELYKITGEHIADGDTTDAGNGMYNVAFNNACIDSTTQCIVKTSYYNFEYFMAPEAWPSNSPDSIIYSTDTLWIARSSISPTPVVTVTNASCISEGSITVSSPVGADYLYSLDNAVFQSSPVFSNVPAGMHTITVNNINTGCSSTITVTVSGSQSPVTIKYPENTYCNTDTAVLLPVITGAAGGGTFTAIPPGLLLDSSSGEIIIAGSDTAFYTVTFHPTDTSQCTTTTVIRIVDNSKFIWTGAVNSDWENAGNWSCGNLPGSNSDVVIYEGSVVINSNVTVKSLTVGPGTSLTITTGSSLTVTGP